MLQPIQVAAQRLQRYKRALGRKVEDMEGKNAIETAVALATHASEIKHLQADMDKLVEDMNDVKQTLNAINSTLSEAKGGWRVLMMVGGAGGVFGAVVTWLIENIGK